MLAPPYPEQVVSGPFGSEVVPQDALPVPVVARVMETVAPADSEDTIPQALIHFAFPSGHLPNIRNWPALELERLIMLVEVMPAASATGTPMQKGSFVRTTPLTLPGYNAS
jgi:hypothetical protein